MPKNRLFARLVLTSCAVSGIACGGTSERRGREPHVVVVDTIGDTVRVRTERGSVWSGVATLELEMSVGVLEGEDAYMFGSIYSMAVDDSGAIYVMDRQVPVLRKYDAAGHHLFDLGRQGGLAVLSDGRVVQRDPGNVRMNIYGPDGAALTSWRLPSGGGFNTGRKLFRDARDNTYTMVLADRTADVTEWTYALVPLTPEGQPGDTLFAPTWDFGRPQVSGRTENNSSSTGVPFSPTSLWTFSPAGYFVGSLTTAYRVDLFRHDGVLRIEKNFTPVSVLSEEREEQERRITENFRSQFPGWRWNGPPIPDTKPPVRGLYVADDERIWVQISQTGVARVSEEAAAVEEERTGSPQIRFQEPVVFEPDGRYLGQVTTPVGFATSPEPVFRGEQVWAVTRDDLDVLRVVRYRLRLPTS
jgi:hypothetical protein